jgi:hypothetical protein
MKVGFRVLAWLCLSPGLIQAQCLCPEGNEDLRRCKKFYGAWYQSVAQSLAGLQSFSAQFDVTYRSPSIDTSGLSMAAIPDFANHRYYGPFLALFEYEAEARSGLPEGKMARESWLRFQSEAETHLAFTPQGIPDGTNPLRVRATVRRLDYLNRFRFRITAVAGAPVEIHFKGHCDTLDVPGATRAFQFIKEKMFTDISGPDAADEFHLDETLLLMGPWKTETTESELYPGYKCFRAWPLGSPDLRCCVRVRLQCHPLLAHRILNKTDFAPLWKFLRDKS